MSRNIGPWIEYKCFNDCSQMGCRGHEIRANYYETSDTLGFDRRDKDGKEEMSEYVFDPDQWKAMVKAEESLP